MDKDEYKAYRETILRKKQQEESRKEMEKRVKPYDPKKMDVSRIPLGCLLILLSLIVAVIYGFMRATRG